jgi:hypothetical protein
MLAWQVAQVGKIQGRERNFSQCVGDTTPTPAYLLQYSAVAPSSLSVNDAGSGVGRYVDWRGGAGNGFRVGVEGVLSGEPILGMFAKSG